MTATATTKPEALYLGDNGRCLCGEHLGATARHTGRDLSGQPVMEVTPPVAKDAKDMGVTLQCEKPRCGRIPSTLYLP